MEVLGAVSSVFAVVSLAIQLGSSVQKLIDFWDSVKEAPAEVAQIKSHLLVLGSLLRSIERDAHEGHNSQDEIGIECLRICTFSIAKLERLSAVLDRGMSGSASRRRWTCLRKSMREQEITKYWNELERAKSMLMLYQAWRMG
jgi:hypothetical protein